MRAAFWGGLRIKAAEAAALKSGRKGGSRTELERKYQAGGGHSGMSVFVDFEAGHLEIGSLIDESAILCAQGNMFGYRHIESASIDEGTSGLLVIYRSPTWIEEHGSASREHEWRYYLQGRHLEGGKLHNGNTSRA